MKTIFFAVIALLSVIGHLSSLTTTAQQKNKPRVRESMIVSTDWLGKRLKDASLVLLQVGENDDYVAGHIPRAQFITLADISTPRGEGLTLELPTVAQLKATFEKLGVSNSSRIVVYFSKDWVSPTARVYLTLDYLATNYFRVIPEMHNSGIGYHIARPSPRPSGISCYH